MIQHSNKQSAKSQRMPTNSPIPVLIPNIFRLNIGMFQEKHWSVGWTLTSLLHLLKELITGHDWILFQIRFPLIVVYRAVDGRKSHNGFQQMIRIQGLKHNIGVVLGEITCSCQASSVVEHCAIPLGACECIVFETILKNNLFSSFAFAGIDTHE